MLCGNTFSFFVEIASFKRQFILYFFSKCQNKNFVTEFTHCTELGYRANKNNSNNSGGSRPGV